MNVIHIEHPNGYTNINAEYLVMSMPCYDIDKAVLSMSRDTDPERIYDNVDIIINLMIEKAFTDKVLGPRRFWQIVKRLKRLGVLEGWTEESVLEQFKKEEEC